jgi:hypothetical protein
MENAYALPTLLRVAVTMASIVTMYHRSAGRVILRPVARCIHVVVHVPSQDVLALARS